MVGLEKENGKSQTKLIYNKTRQKGSSFMLSTSTFCFDYLRRQERIGALFSFLRARGQILPTTKVVLFSLNFNSLLFIYLFMFLHHSF